MYCCLQAECREWVHTAQLLTSQLLGESVDSLFPKPITTDTEAPRKSLMDVEISYHDKERLEAAATQPTEKVWGVVQDLWGRGGREGGKAGGGGHTTNGEGMMSCPAFWGGGGRRGGADEPGDQLPRQG